MNTVAPSLSGTAQDGVPLTAASGAWSGIATITFAYQWQESSDGGVTWSNIAGATASAYTPPAGFAGNQVRVQVTATNGDGSSQAASPASAVILPGQPVPPAPTPPQSTSPIAATQPLPPQPSPPASSPSTQSGTKPAPKPTKPKAKRSKSQSKLGITHAPWLKPLSFHPAAGWHVGTSGTVRTARNSVGKAVRLRYPESTAWTANVRYRDPATAEPPQRTVSNLGKSGIVVTAVIKPPSNTKQRLSLDLRNARPFNCCDGILPSPTRSFELVGLIGSRRYEVIIDVFFGTTPTGRLWANAQQAVRRIQLPRGR